MTKNKLLDLIEESLLTVTVAFADDSKLGVHCLQMITLPDDDKNNLDIENLYKSIKSNSPSQTDLANNIVKSLQFLRESCLKSDKIKKEIENQIKLMIEQIAITDYCRQEKIDK